MRGVDEPGELPPDAARPRPWVDRDDDETEVPASGSRPVGVDHPGSAHDSPSPNGEVLADRPTGPGLAEPGQTEPAGAAGPGSPAVGLPGDGPLAGMTGASSVLPAGDATGDSPEAPGVSSVGEGGERERAAISGVLDQDAAPPPTPSRAVPPLPRWIAVANQKGGVGKTTTAVNLGACLAELDYRVLIVDLDPQGNATTGLGLNPRELDASMYDVILNDVAIEDCVEPSAVRNLFVAPASLDLAGAEIELVPAFSRELRLRRALEPVTDDYDFVLIDCPPSLGLLTINGLAAATEVLVPIQCEYYALEGLGQLLRNVGLVQRNLNPRLELRTIVLVMYDARTKLSDQVVREVRDHFGDTVCRIVIPRTVRLSEAPSYGQPIVAFDPTSRGAIAYRELAKEVSGGAPQRTR